MLAPGEVSESEIIFDTDDVAYWTKADELPNAKKQISVRPSVKTKAERIRFEDSPNFGERGNKPAAIAVAADRFPVAAPPAAVPDAVRGVGEDHIYGFVGEAPQQFSAVSVIYGYVPINEIGLCGSRFHLMDRMNQAEM